MEDFHDQLPQSIEALVEVINRNYHKSLTFYAIGLCQTYRLYHCQADDIMQNFYISIYRSEDSVRRGLRENGVMYLRKMVKYQVIDELRKYKSYTRVKDTFGKQRPANVHIVYMDASVHYEEFLEFMCTVLDDENFEIMRKYLEGYTHEEIAKYKEMNTSTVGVRIHRAKQKVRQELESLKR